MELVRSPVFMSSTVRALSVQVRSCLFVIVTVTGPTISGCRLEDTDSSHRTIEVTFNISLLRGDSVAITRTQTPLPPDPETGLPAVPDSSLMHVCTGDPRDCACLSFGPNGTKVHGKFHGIRCEMPADGGEPRAPQSARADVWIEVPVAVAPNGTNRIVADLSALNASDVVHAIKFGWAIGAGTCCVDAKHMQGLAPCVP
jgi:hypothetical protein